MPLTDAKTGSAPLTLQHPAKAAYALCDFERSARFLGIPYRRPTRFPLPTQNAARAYYWLHGQDCALARRFAHADGGHGAARLVSRAGPQP